MSYQTLLLPCINGKVEKRVERRAAELRTATSPLPKESLEHTDQVNINGCVQKRALGMGNNLKLLCEGC